MPDQRRPGRWVPAAARVWARWEPARHHGIPQLRYSTEPLPSLRCDSGAVRTRRLSRPAVALAATALGALLLAAGAVGWVLRPEPAPAAPADTAARVVLPRPKGTPVVTTPRRDANLLLRPLSYECGQPSVFGTHAELDADGAYCRVDVEVVNAGVEEHHLHTQDQHLVLGDGSRLDVDPSAMAVRRQGDDVVLGGHQRRWLELWFDVPAGATAAAVAMAGDADPPAYLATAPAARTPGGVLFPLGAPP